MPVRRSLHGRKPTLHRNPMRPMFNGDLHIGRRHSTQRKYRQRRGID
jgi:hypothetical protein